MVWRSDHVRRPPFTKCGMIIGLHVVKVKSRKKIFLGSFLMSIILFYGIILNKFEFILESIISLPCYWTNNVTSLNLLLKKINMITYFENLITDFHILSTHVKFYVDRMLFTIGSINLIFFIIFTIKI